jgi:hypothetical protein
MASLHAILGMRWLKPVDSTAWTAPTRSADKKSSQISIMLPEWFVIDSPHMRLPSTLLLSCLLALGLTGCDSGGDSSIPVSMFENDTAEAVVRRMITDLPDLNPGVPITYSIILGELSRSGGYRAASLDFIKRFDDLDLRIISADALSAEKNLRAIVDPETRVAVVLLQVRTMAQTSASTWRVETGWSYKQRFSKDRWSVDTSRTPAKAEHVDTVESGDGTSAESES